MVIGLPGAGASLRSVATRTGANVQHTRHASREVVASPHHLASATGAAVLRDGGNAVDAAVATNLVLAVATPYFCGAGGDLFALVAEPDGQVHGLASAGRTPAGLTLDHVRSVLPEPTPAKLPDVGPLPVTVPGAVAGWHALLDGHGTRSFASLAAPAIRYARDGVPVGPTGRGAFERAARRYVGQPSWDRAFGTVAATGVLLQPALADFLEAVAQDGPGALYGGVLGEQLVAFLSDEGSPMSLEDLAGHEVSEVEPMATAYGDLEVLELPPPTQGVTALQALGVADRLRRRHDGHDTDEVDRVHLQVEAVRAALVDREAHVADPSRMLVDPASLVTDGRLDELAAAVDLDRAAAWPPATPRPGGTAYLCAADEEGRTISLIQSNFMGFGSGLVSPAGVALQNRAAGMRLDASHPDRVGPGVVPMHTLVPALARRDGEVVLTFGTMGGDGQPQTHLQVLDRLRRGVDLQPALADWRFLVQPDDGLVVVEGRAPTAVVDGLRHRGHEVHVVEDWSSLLGHAHAIQRTPHGWAAATDPRAAGAVVGA